MRRWEQGLMNFLLHVEVRLPTALLQMRSFRFRPRGCASAGQKGQPEQSKVRSQSMKATRPACIQMQADSPKPDPLPGRVFGMICSWIG